jgi:hypothetical protein
LRRATSKPLHFFTSKQAVLIIQAYPKKGVVAVSYKGVIKKGKFDDNTMSNMMKGVRFEQNAEQFLSAVAKLIHEAINN